VWFNNDNLLPSPDHVPYLHHRFEADMVSEHVGTMPYILGLRVPYNLYIGHKPLLSTAEG
jgi:S-adenosylmethionine-diacylgycerolhomoserine-N-methlytransferase